jgi:hypothetical protein
MQSCANKRGPSDAGEAPWAERCWRPGENGQVKCEFGVIHVSALCLVICRIANRSQHNKPSFDKPSSSDSWVSATVSTQELFILTIVARHNPLISHQMASVSRRKQIPLIGNRDRTRQVLRWRNLLTITCPNHAVE